MPWVKLDDQFPDHPKVDGLSDGAFRLHIAGLCHSARYLTDGLIPAERVPRLVPRFRAAQLHQLVERTLWIEHGDVFEINDFTDYNKSRLWWESERRKKAERVAKWRAEHRDDDGTFNV